VLEGWTKGHTLGDLDIKTIEFAPDASFVVLGCRSGRVVVWRFGSEPVLLEGHAEEVVDIVVRRDGRTAVSVGLDDRFCVWDLESVKLERQFAAGIGRPDAAAVTHDGVVGFAIYGHALVAFDLEASIRVSSLSFDEPVTAIAAAPSGTHIAIGDFAGRVHFVSLSR
jgi:WD40 repeat protein